jgi:hypothetical protein
MSFENHLFFYRTDRGGLDCAVVAIIHSEYANPSEVMEHLRKAVTAWVQETDEGKKVWKYSSEDLNIGDIADEIDGFFFVGPGKPKKPRPAHSIDSYLQQNGFQSIELIQIGTCTMISYDRVLVDTSRLKEA